MVTACTAAENFEMGVVVDVVFDWIKGEQFASSFTLLTHLVPPHPLPLCALYCNHICSCCIHLWQEIDLH